MMTTPHRHPCPIHVPRPGRAAPTERLIGAVVVSVVTIALALSAGAAPAGAQTPGAGSAVPSTTLAPPASDPSPFSAGGIVFFAVFAIVVGGAAVLYLRNRGTGTNAVGRVPASAPPPVAPEADDPPSQPPSDRP